jgi:hypothetical protein
MIHRNNMNLIPYKSIHNSVRFDDDFPKGLAKGLDRLSGTMRWIQEIGQRE